MAVSPLDLQTNIGHIHDVAKQAQIKTETLANQHQFLDREAEHASNRQKDRLDANRETDESRMESAKERENREKREKREKKLADAVNKESDEKDKPHDPILGNNIDFIR